MRTCFLFRQSTNCFIIMKLLSCNTGIHSKFLVAITCFYYNRIIYLLFCSFALHYCTQTAKCIQSIFYRLKAACGLLTVPKVLLLVLGKSRSIFVELKPVLEVLCRMCHLLELCFNDGVVDTMFPTSLAIFIKTTKAYRLVAVQLTLHRGRLLDACLVFIPRNPAEPLARGHSCRWSCYELTLLTYHILSYLCSCCCHLPSEQFTHDV